MNLSNEGFSTGKDEKSNISIKNMTLNPNAAEFFPSALRPSSLSAKNTDGASTDASVTPGKAVFNRSESSVSTNSDDDVHQYWRRQLPDDITPDFKVMKEETYETNAISLASLSINDGLEASRFSGTASATQLWSKRSEISSKNNDNSILNGKVRYSTPSYGEDQTCASMTNISSNLWDKHLVNGGSPFGLESEGHPLDDSSGYLNDLLNESIPTADSEINHVEFLASQFPGFSAESLADIYYANNCDLNLTIEMLVQFEIQVDVGFNQNSSSKTLPAPNLSALDFPALEPSDSQNGLTKYVGDDLHPVGSSFRSVATDNLLHFRTTSSGFSGGTVDYASAVRKIASQDSGQCKYDGNGSTTDMTAGTSNGSRAVNHKSFYGDRLDSHLSSRKAPVWVETGDAVGNMYSELREEARDHARVRNAYFEQARQAYLIGNKALAKELSLKGQMHNLQMKAAHGKAKESIYRQRNPVAPGMQGYGGGCDPMIDLHGLHTNEAIQILKEELSYLRSNVRSAGQRMQVLICVGTGHHTKGSRTPARLPVAVEQFLLERGLEYTEPQPGLLRVVLY